jgi:hypothetical protein
MWRLLVEHGSTEKVVEVMTREFDVDSGRVSQDLDALIKDLETRAIIHVE